MNLTTAFWYAVGIIAALVLIQAFARPIEILARVLGNSIVGGVALWLLNALGGYAGFHLALNPASAAITGLLGIPGVVSLVLMRRILG
ncbi:MAG TPA: pro-sigmaK processing inhibitor BofA family protein [Symbiobacteriaceae bacterium]|nr:pro-sigmaK processing inhibitor BofA family protein [Symbiobacteriaceae bacterium]